MGNQPVENPYVGPRPFQREEMDRFFGREREGRDLLSLVMSERLVLFYAQSGAGKTSLINTRLIPGLEGRGFEVLPVGRVSGDLPQGVEADNIFALNLMLKVDDGADDPARFKGMRLPEFLGELGVTSSEFGTKIWQYGFAGASLAAPTSGDTVAIPPRALIIDQFEELFTTHQEAWRKREDFLKQVAESMEADPYLWVVLAMREDYIAGLDPYTGLLPGGLRARYSMQRLGESAALEAVMQPVEHLRPFERDAAVNLVANLSRISAGREGDGAPRFVPGEYVEPVQLQVVCYQLWEALKDQPGERITQEDINRLARGRNLAEFVNRALADFYSDAVRRVSAAEGVGVTERQLREWFATQMITEGRTRGFVFMGERTTGGIPNAAIKLLEGQLLRGENRAGGRWYELVHDRFIEPILQSNREWAQAQGEGPRAYSLIGMALTLGLALILAVWALLAQRNASMHAGQAAVAAGQAATANAVAYQSDIAAQTAQAQSTLADAVAQAAWTAEADRRYGLVDATSTIQALGVASTAQSLQAQLLALQMGVEATPVPAVLATSTRAVFWTPTRTQSPASPHTTPPAIETPAAETPVLVTPPGGTPPVIPPYDTDPNNPDTDGDGLKDGQEVGVYHTDPKNRDSDGDGLADGQEVNVTHTDPNNPDTDGDGLQDNVDPNPGNLPTPTPTMTPEATETPGPDFTRPAGGQDLPATIQAATADALRAQLDTLYATQTAIAAPVRTLVIGQTSWTTPIWVTQLGTGTRNIVLVGGLHAGFAPGSVDLAQQLVEYYTDHLDEIPADLRLHIVLNANPDAALAPGQRKGRLNARGVDLNRNWGCEWSAQSFFRNQTISGGASAFSEPETAALREYFERTQPAAVVVWSGRAAGGSVSPGGCGERSLFSEALAKIFGGAAHYQVESFQAYAVNGDMTNWLDQQGIPAIFVLLPDYDAPDFRSNLSGVARLLQVYAGR